MGLAETPLVTVDAGLVVEPDALRAVVVGEPGVGSAGAAGTRALSRSHGPKRTGDGAERCVILRPPGSPAEMILRLWARARR